MPVNYEFLKGQFYRHYLSSSSTGATRFSMKLSQLCTNLYAKPKAIGCSLSCETFNENGGR